MASLKHLSKEEKIERKKQQKRDAQKRYYQKNKDYYKNYNKEHNDYCTRNKMAREYMQHYIDVEPDNGTTTPIKIEFKHIIDILKGGFKHE
jgi:hypothetical protein